jgi:hypothetical protein
MCSDLDSQLSAAFGSTAFNHCTSALSGNTGTKTMSTCAVSCVWLVSSFWHISVSIPYYLSLDKSLTVLNEEALLDVI